MDYLIRKGNIDDLDLINLFLEKENDYMSLMNLPKIDIPDLEKEIENGNIYVFKKGKILLGVSCVSLSLKDSISLLLKVARKNMTFFILLIGMAKILLSSNILQLKSIIKTKDLGRYSSMQLNLDSKILSSLPSLIDSIHLILLS